ncbi:hypothetical protein THAOC_21579, partial [Thalassiosira oceanica]
MNTVLSRRPSSAYRMGNSQSEPTSANVVGRKRRGQRQRHIATGTTAATRSINEAAAVSRASKNLADLVAASSNTSAAVTQCLFNEDNVARTSKTLADLAAAPSNT